MDIVSTTDRAIIIIVFTLFIAAQLVYAFYSRKNMQKTAIDKYVNEFYTGGRGMGSVVVALIVAAGVCGAGVFMTMPGRAWSVGQTFMFCCFWSLTMNFLVLGQVGKKTGIVARRANIQSFVGLIYDRFDRSKVIGILSGVFMLLFFGMFAANTYSGGARLFEAMTGLSYNMGLVIFTVVVLVASLMGGVKGVATAIVFQGAVMTLSIVVFFVLGANTYGGFEGAYRVIADISPEWFSLSTMKWQQVVSIAITLGFFTFTMPQATMGALVHKNTKSLHSAIKVGLIVVFIWSMGINLMIPVLKAQFPTISEMGSSADMGIPLLAMTTMPAWVAGLILAGVCAAVQSSLNGMVVCLSSLIVNDMYLMFFPKTNKQNQKKVTLTSTAAICIIIFLLALDPPPLLAVVGVYASGGLAAAFAAPMLLGYYWRRANKYGCLAGMVLGVLIYVLVDNKIILASFPFGGIVAGFVVSVIAVIVVSLLTPKSSYKTIKRWFCASYYDEDGKLVA